MDNFTGQQCRQNSELDYFVISTTNWQNVTVKLTPKNVYTN